MSELNPQDSDEFPEELVAEIARSWLDNALLAHDVTKAGVVDRIRSIGPVAEYRDGPSLVTVTQQADVILTVYEACIATSVMPDPIPADLLHSYDRTYVDAVIESLILHAQLIDTKPALTPEYWSVTPVIDQSAVSLQLAQLKTMLADDEHLVLYRMRNGHRGADMVLTANKGGFRDVTLRSRIDILDSRTGSGITFEPQN